MLLRRKPLFIALFLCAILLLACDKKKSTNEDAELYIKLGAMPSMDYIPYVIAEHMGINDSLGLKVDIIKFNGANERDAALRAGQVDGTVIDYTGAAIQHAGGMELSLVIKHDGFFEMMTNPQINTLSDLKSKKVGVSRNTVIEYATDQMLESAAVLPEEVQKIEVNQIPLRLEQIFNNELDGSIFPDPFISISKSKGFKSISSTRDLGISVTGTVFTKKAIEEKSEAISRLIEGYNIAVEYMRRTPREVWADILVTEARIPETLVMSLILPNYTFAEAPSLKDIEMSIVWLKKKGLVPDTYKAEGLVDNRFIEGTISDVTE